VVTVSAPAQAPTATRLLTVAVAATAVVAVVVTAAAVVDGATKIVIAGPAATTANRVGN